MVVDKRFFGAPADESNPQARVGICGRAPDGEHLRVTAELLSTEHTLYPPAFLKTIGLQFYLLCEDLSYNNQRRSTHLNFFPFGSLLATKSSFPAQLS